jgi:hypothetical protein
VEEAHAKVDARDVWDRQMRDVQVATGQSFDGRETQTTLNEYHNPS